MIKGHKIDEKWIPKTQQISHKINYKKYSKSTCYELEGTKDKTNFVAGKEPFKMIAKLPLEVVMQRE